MRFQYKVIIPSRYASTRLPGKPLLDIAGKPLLQHVYETARSSRAEKVIIATDDDRIQAVARSFGAEVIMTSRDHKSGTDRLAEVINRLEEPDDSIIVNLQGDEFGMPPELVDQVACALHANTGRSMASLCEPIKVREDYENSNVVKVVMDATNAALYFSRSPVPWSKQGWFPGCAHRHIGLYAYRCGFLRKFSATPVCALEQSESLEQLRALFQGEKIHIEIARSQTGIGIDTPEDLEKARSTIT